MANWLKSPKSRAFLITAAAIVVAGGLWAYWRGRDDVEYKTVPLSTGAIQATVSATGTCNAVTTVQVGSQVSGNVQALYADYNSRVKQGQLIARIDPQPFQARVDQAQASLDAAQASVATARATLDKSVTALAAAQASLSDSTANLSKAKFATENARITLNRQTALFHQAIIDAQDLETAQAAYDAAVASQQGAAAELQAAKDNLREAKQDRDVDQAQLLSSQAQLKEAQASLQQAQIDLDHTYIRAPVNGTVISRNVDVGQTVAASFSAPTLFVIAKDLTKMKIDTNVDEADIGKVRDGQTATFTVDAFPRDRFKGQVIEIREAPIDVQNVVTYDVVIAVSNPQLKLMPGMTANVTIAVARRANVIRIPEAALRYQPPLPALVLARETRGLESNQRQIVWVLPPDGNPRPVAVDLGISDGTYAALVRGNLTAGERVIVGSTGGGSTGSTPFGSRRMRL
jgi:HlyD family secretion protein